MGKATEVGLELRKDRYGNYAGFKGVRSPAEIVGEFYQAKVLPRTPIFFGDKPEEVKVAVELLGQGITELSLGGKVKAQFIEDQGAVYLVRTGR